MPFWRIGVIASIVRWFTIHSVGNMCLLNAG